MVSERHAIHDALLDEVLIPEKPVVKIGIPVVRMYLQPNTTTSIAIIRQQRSDATEHRRREAALPGDKCERAACHHISNLKKSNELGRGGQDVKCDSIRSHVARSALQSLKASRKELILVCSAPTRAVDYDDAVCFRSLTLLVGTL
jgi:hypothetical protein